MMNYLKKYNISDEQINNIKIEIEKKGLNIDKFKYDPEGVISILDLFVSIGVSNIYEIIMANPSIFRDTISSIKNRIYKYNNTSELARLLNEDANNLSLVGLI